jgi:hypothetical protein
VTQVAEQIDEFDGAVGAVNLLRFDALDGFQQLVVVGVVGEWQRVVDLPAVLRSWVDGPAGAGDRNGAAEAGEAEGIHAAREGDDDRGERRQGEGETRRQGAVGRCNIRGDVA